MKVWRIVFFFLGIPPLTFIASLLIFYFHAIKILGRSPSYSNPDPKDLPIYGYYSPYVNFAGNSTQWLFIAWFLLVIIYLIAERKNIKWTPVIFSALSYLLAILLFTSNIFEWYID